MSISPSFSLPPAVDLPSGRPLFSHEQWRGLMSSLNLSGREAQIVQALFSDESEAVIAHGLGISVHTVHTHLERLYRKLNVHSRCGVLISVFVEYVEKHERQAASLERGSAAAPRAGSG